jgi:hypothetical protein
MTQNRARMIHNRQGSVKTRKRDGEKGRDGPPSRLRADAPGDGAKEFDVAEQVELPKRQLAVIPDQVVYTKCRQGRAIAHRPRQSHE